MTTKEKIEAVEQTGYIELLYQTAKIIAESDSIGEAYSYCREYQRVKPENQYSQCFDFETDVACIKGTVDQDFYDESGYLSVAIGVYELYKPFQNE